MASPNRLALVLLAAVLTLPVAAFAQSAANAPAPPRTQQQSLRTLQQQAARLTLLARIPQADRAQATQLLDRWDALRRRARNLRIQQLQAYVDALKAGSDPAAARAQARQKVSDLRQTLVGDLGTFRSDVRAFLQKVPQARGLLRELGAGYGTGPSGRMGNRPAQRGAMPYGEMPNRARPYGEMPNRAMPYGNAPWRNGRWQGPWRQGWMSPPWERSYGRWGMPWDRGGAAPWRWQPGGGAPGGNGAPQNSTPQNSTPPGNAPTNGAPSTGGSGT